MKSHPESASKRKRAAELIEIAEATRDQLLIPTVPLYHDSESRAPQVIGSGVLVSLAGLRFLLTAGHVLDLRRQGQLDVGVSPELLPLTGEPMRLRSPGSSGTSGDRIDMGIVRLQGGPWDSLPLDRFLAFDRLDTEIPIVARHSYALIGFPNSMNRSAIADSRLTAMAISIAGLECPAKSYEETKTDPELNVMIGIEKNAVWTVDGQRSAPDLYGASGCGLWRYGRRVRDSVGPPKLSAIATEWHKKGRHRHVLGTRITFILGAIADKYVEVRGAVDLDILP